mgnify:CR=1 FL=1
MSTMEIIRTAWRGVPCEIVFQPCRHHTEMVVYVNPDGLNLPAWPMGHRTIHGASLEQWEMLKKAANGFLSDEEAGHAAS